MVHDGDDVEVHDDVVAHGGGGGDGVAAHDVVHGGVVHDVVAGNVVVVHDDAVDRGVEARDVEVQDGNDKVRLDTFWYYFQISGKDIQRFKTQQ